MQTVGEQRNEALKVQSLVRITHALERIADTMELTAAIRNAPASADQNAVDTIKTILFQTGWQTVKPKLNFTSGDKA